jgi:hypothetical protein
MPSPINTVPVQQFLQQVKAAELGQQKELKLDIKTAKLLAFCLGEVMAKIVEDQDMLFAKLQQSQGTGDISVRMDGGGFGSA